MPRRAVRPPKVEVDCYVPHIRNSWCCAHWLTDGHTFTCTLTWEPCKAVKLHDDLPDILLEDKNVIVAFKSFSAVRKRR